MPEYLTPGVYVEEIQTGPRPIEGVSTSTAGMVGFTERGPEAPRLVTSWLDYQRSYGGYVSVIDSYLPYAVQGFFDNGGKRLYVARVVASDAGFAALSIADNNLRIQAIGSGAWGNNVFIRVSNGSKRNAANNYFRLDVLYFLTEPPNPDNIVDPLNPANSSDTKRRDPDKVETYDNLTHVVGMSNNVAMVVNTNSALIRVTFPVGPLVVPVVDPPNYRRLENGVDGARDAGTSRLTGLTLERYQGDTELIDDSDTTGLLYGRGRGLAALETIDEIALLAVPDEVLFEPVGLISPVTDTVIKQCERLKDRFAVVSSRREQTAVQDVFPPQDTTYAAFYYPWIEIYDPVAHGPILVPSGGHVLGLIARTDIERGVHKAPANEVVRGATNLQFPISKESQGTLNPRGVNCVRDFRSDGRGIRLWGARTMSSDAMWKYVNVRRLFIFIEESIDEGTQWVVFEPNDEPLWAQVRRSISSFLYGVWKSGALMGLTQEEAFFVKCDRTTMTQDDIDNGRLVCYIGIAPVKPAEFVIFRISQKTAEAPA